MLRILEQYQMILHMSNRNPEEILEEMMAKIFHSSKEHQVV